MPPLPELTLAVPDDLRFIMDLGVAVALALVGGIIAVRLRQPPIVGYLLAGVVIGPFTPGFVGDTAHISELAEVGVVLLLFALGVEFSISKLAPVRRIAVPGAIIQVLIITVVAAGIGIPIGLPAPAALVVGAAVAISSTVVVLKLLAERGELDSLHGRAGDRLDGRPGPADDPAHRAARAVRRRRRSRGSRRCSPCCGPPCSSRSPTSSARGCCPGCSGRSRASGRRSCSCSPCSRPRCWPRSSSSAVFGLSLALGAFVAGLIVSESELSHQAAGEITPFRDLFAVLFFVSVGMLLDPAAMVEDWPALLALLVVATVGKAAVSAGLGRLLGLPLRSALLLGATIAQVGEFSFLLAEQALSLDLLDTRGYNLVLGTAVASIVLTPVLVSGAVRLIERLEHAQLAVEPPVEAVGGFSRGEGVAGEDGGADRPAVVVLGAGRVGRVVVRAVRSRGFRCVVIDRDPGALDEAATTGAATLFGDAASVAILRRAGLDGARLLVITIGDAMTARLAVERARAINPRLTVIARARGRTETTALQDLGVTRLADPEIEAAIELARASLARMGVSGPEQAAVTVGLRRRHYGERRSEQPGPSGDGGRAAGDQR